MNPESFERRLRAEGFAEVATARLDPSDAPAVQHAHDYDVEALVLEGEITLICEGGAQTYRAGDVFTMKAGRNHAEQVGPSGVRYLVGRRR